MANREKVTKNIINILIIITSCILIFSVYKLGSIWWEYHSNRKTQEKVQQLFYGEQESVGSISGDTEDSAHQYHFDLKPVIEANPETVAWIKVPGTKVDYAVMQAADNDKYLRMGFYGEENTAGSIFMDAANQPGDRLQNLILYGHRMKDGSMFGELGEFLDYGFYQQNPTFTLYMQDQTYECEIFAVYQCGAEVKYCQTFFSDEEALLAYAQECQARSVYQTNIEITGQDTLVTLSTCDYAEADGRLVVHAKLVPTGEADESTQE